MKNLKLWQKMAVGIGAILMLVMGTGLITLLSMQEIAQEIAEVKNKYVPAADQVSGVQIRMKDAPIAMQQYLATDDKAFYEAAEKAMAESLDLINHLHATAEKENFISVEQTVGLVDDYTSYRNLVRQAYANNEEFIEQRTEMLRSAGEVEKAVETVRNFLLETLKKAMQAGDLGDIAATAERLILIEHLKDLSAQAALTMNRALSTQNKDHVKDLMPSIWPEIEQVTQTLDGMVRFPAMRTAMNAVKNDSAKFKEAQVKMLDLWQQTDDLTAVSGQARAKVLKQADALSASIIKTQNDTLTSVDVNSDQSLYTVAILSALQILIALAVGFFMTRSITGAMSRTVRFAQQVAGGHLEERMNLRQKDEFGQLAVALDSMVDSLEEKINEANHKSQQALEKEAEATKAMELAEAAGREAQSKTESMLVAADKLEQVAQIVSSASTQLSAQIEQSGRGAEQQASVAAETATAMEEMTATVLEVAKNAGTASEVSLQTRHKAEEGANIVHKSVESIQQVQRESLELKDAMSELAQHAQSISQIMSVISDIADQTNLLALNAAIEAARAGEAGRGFAVVADEVRKLAEKTMSSTHDVGNAIQSIQESVGKSMTQVDKAVSVIEETTGYASQSGEALREIVSMADQTASQVQGIAAASEEQSATSEEINRSVGQVNTIAGETARAMEEAAQAVSELAEQAQSLTSLIEAMKQG